MQEYEAKLIRLGNITIRYLVDETISITDVEIYDEDMRNITEELSIGELTHYEDFIYSRENL
jgi:hypothetical protein